MPLSARNSDVPDAHPEQSEEPRDCELARTRSRSSCSRNADGIAAAYVGGDQEDGESPGDLTPGASSCERSKGGNLHGLVQPPGNKNKLTEANRQRISDAFTARADADHFARLIENDAIAQNGYNISVSAYVGAENTREVVDIGELNAQIARIVARQAELRREIDSIVADLESDAS